MTSSRTTAPAQDTLLYDGHCPRCRAAAHRLQRWARPRLAATSFRDPAVLARFPYVDLEQCERATLLVRDDGVVFEGEGALVEALRRRWFGPLLWLVVRAGLLRWLPGHLRFEQSSPGACAVHG